MSDTQFEYYYEGFKVNLISEMPTAGVAEVQDPKGRLQGGKVFSVGMASLDKREVVKGQDGEKNPNEVPPQQAQLKNRKP